MNLKRPGGLDAILSRFRGPLGRSLLLNSIDYPVQLAAMFIVTPAMARGLGQEGYGHWLMLMAVVGYLPLLEAGVSSAGTKFLASARHAPDPTLFSRRLGAVHRALWRSGWIAGLLMLVAAVVAGFILPTPGRLPLPVSTTVLLAFLPATLLTFWMRERLLILRAFLRYDLIVYTTLARTVVQTALVLWILGHSNSLEWLALAHAVPQSLCCLAQHIIGGRQLAANHRRMLRPELDDKASLREISNHVFASQIASSLSSKAEPFLVSWSASLSAVPIHGIARRFTGMLADAFQTVFGPVFTASYSTLAGSGRTAALHTELGRGCRLAGSLGGCACAILHFVAKPFIHVWLPASFAQCPALLDWLLPGLALRLASIPASAFLLASGGHRVLSKLSWILSVSSLGFMTALGLTHNILGIFAGLGISEFLLFAFVMPVFFKEWLPSTGMFFCKNIFGPALLGAMVPALIALAVPHLLKADYLLLLIFGLVAAAAALPLAGLLYLKRPVASAQPTP